MHHAADLWNRIVNRLTTDMPQWRSRVEGMGQVSAVRERATGRRWADDEVFKGLILSVLSNNTDWAKVEGIVQELSSVFHGFSLSEYASLTPADIELRFVPWFQERSAGSQSLGRGLTYAIDAAGELLALRAKYGSLERYFGELLQESDGDVISVALALGSTSSPHKLPGLGIPLAAEFLKNIGFDVAKPDRHMNRAAGCFGWVEFRGWRDRNGWKSPSAGKPGMLEVMRAAADFANALGQPVCFVDNAVWLLCAQSGLHLSNRALCALRGNDAALPPRPTQEEVPTATSPSVSQRDSTGSRGPAKSGENSHLTVPERVEAICEEIGADGRTIERAEIIRRAARMGMNPNSVQPADWCDNTRTSQWSTHPKFLYALGPGRYVLRRFAGHHKS